jgi:hypothetical protein
MAEDNDALKNNLWILCRDAEIEDAEAGKLITVFSEAVASEKPLLKQLTDAKAGLFPHIVKFLEANAALRQHFWGHYAEEYRPSADQSLISDWRSPEDLAALQKVSRCSERAHNVYGDIFWCSMMVTGISAVPLAIDTYVRTFELTAFGMATFAVLGIPALVVAAINRMRRPQVERAMREWGVAENQMVNSKALEEAAINTVQLTLEQPEIMAAAIASRPNVMHLRGDYGQKAG